MKKNKKPKVNKQTTEKTKAKIETKISGDMQYLTTDPTSPLYCEKCNEYIGILKSIKSAIFKKQGSEYIVKCKHCGTYNVRIKGQLKGDLKKRWD